MSEKVKLVIEIPKDYYEIIKCEVEQNQTDYYPFVVIGNGIPLDEVLADIKAEIKEYSKKWLGLDYYDGINSAIEAIDEHIEKEGTAND